MVSERAKYTANIGVATISVANSNRNKAESFVTISEGMSYKYIS